MQLCTVKIAVVSLLLVVTPTMGSDCETTPPPDCVTTPICPGGGGSNPPTNNGTDTSITKFLVTYNDCANYADGTTLLDLRHCRRYYICANQRAMRNRCSLGSWYDKSTRTCRPRAEVTNCAANRN